MYVCVGVCVYVFSETLEEDIRSPDCGYRSYRELRTPCWVPDLNLILQKIRNHFKTSEPLSAAPVPANTLMHTWKGKTEVPHYHKLYSQLSRLQGQHIPNTMEELS